MAEKITELIDQLAMKYVLKLGETVSSLKQLKKDGDPATRLFNGMGTLPELKERVIIYKQLLEDLKELKEQCQK